MPHCSFAYFTALSRLSNILLLGMIDFDSESVTATEKLLPHSVTVAVITRLVMVSRRLNVSFGWVIASHHISQALPAHANSRFASVSSVISYWQSFA